MLIRDPPNTEENDIPNAFQYLPHLNPCIHTVNHILILITTQTLTLPYFIGIGINNEDSIISTNKTLYAGLFYHGSIAARHLHGYHTVCKQFVNEWLDRLYKILDAV